MQVTAKGKRVLVTAGATGIGRATALAFLEAGASVHVCDLDQSALTAVSQIGIDSSRTDVSSSSEIEALFAKIEAKWGGLDILVNNAGIAGPTKVVEHITDDEWAATIGVNINGAFFALDVPYP